ncbi:MAG: glutamate decarboxylase/sulfinoalanine decarboxylase/sulfinoalanine decarboxylase / aspartate 1-decarboxylase [Candidatus Kentron sp. G]|nr:MAG: glutamate decarboxylase/sulfinoalanine decarboxylase/sulfinoalanine decarboxylase / aspartate 1-decarboxylase [Candidatus Kentron sp. G]
MSNHENSWTRLKELLTDLEESESVAPVRKPIDSQHAASRLDLALPEKGIDFDSFMGKLKNLALATPSSASKQFFNQLFAGRDSAAIIGETIAAALNSSMYTWRIAGPQVIIERLLIRELNNIVGYGNGEGTFSPGGSISNLIAMLIARNRFDPNARAKGFNITGTIYTSVEGHYSIRKNAGILGIGRNNVREIHVDDHGRMRADLLEEAITEDKENGIEPILINATAGTTVRGAFDPFTEIGLIARRHGIWFHVDGAFGGPLLMCEQMRRRFIGVEQSDSFTWDAHKLMGVPLTCSVLLVKEKGTLLHNLYEQAGYLYQGDEDEIEPGMTSIQCGRRNDALKLWSIWQVRGRVGYAEQFSKLLGLIRYAAGIIRNDPLFSIVSEPQSLTLCFEVVGYCSRTICTKLEEQQRALVGFGNIDNRVAIRLVCVNPEMEEEDIAFFFEQIRAITKECNLESR